MVNVGFGKSQSPAGVLAPATIAFPESPKSEAQPLAGNPVVSAQDYNCRDSDSAPDHSDRAITLPDGKLAPIVPGKGRELFFAMDVESTGLTVDHGAKDLGGAG